MESLFYKHKKDQHTLMKKIATIFIKSTERSLNERPFRWFLLDRNINYFSIDIITDK